MSTYTPSGFTAKNDSGAILTFGTVSNTNVVKADASDLGVEIDVPHATSARKIYSSGSLDVHGNYVQLATNQTLINGVANAQAGVIGLKAADRSAGRNTGYTVAITAIDAITGVVTYSSNSFSTYNFVQSDGVTAAVDNPEAAMATPYDVPPTLTYLNTSSVGETVNYSVANA